MELLIEGISKHYGNTLALEDINLELKNGITALIGPNGSGKTTFMNILTGNLRFDCGRIRYRAGHSEVLFEAFDAKYFSFLGYMPQYPGMYPNFTVEQFLNYMALLKNLGANNSRSVRKRIIADHIEQALQLVNLTEYRNSKMSALSGGMNQRLGVAQAILGNPKIIILDEPTAGLDPEQRISIRNLISNLSFEKIVIIATHIVSDIEFFSDRIVFLKKGHVVGNGIIKDFLNSINGMVWEVCCDKDDVNRIKDNYPTTSILYDGINEKAIIRVLSEKKPSDSAKKVLPSLEDYYLNAYKGVSN